MQMLQNEIENSGSENQLAKFPNIFALGTSGLNLILKSYQLFYASTRNRVAEFARLPVQWPTDLNDAQLSIEKGKFAPFRVSVVSSGSNEVQLEMELKSGKMKWNKTEEITIKSWKVSLKTTIDLKRAKTCTDDLFPYYKSSFEKLKENYLGVNQLYLKTQDAVISSEIDFNKATLTTEQKQAITKKFGLLVSKHINVYPDFVSFFIGTISKDVNIDVIQRYLFFPGYLAHSVFKDENTSEIRIHFRNMAIGSYATWKGDLSKSILPYIGRRPNGVLLFGQASFFTFLIKGMNNSNTYDVIKNGKQIVKIQDANPNHSVVIQLLEGDEKVIFRVEYNYNFVAYSKLPVLGSPKDFFEIKYSMRGCRDFEIGMELDVNEKSLKMTLVKEDISNPKNDALYIEQFGKEEKIQEDSEEFKSIVAGKLTELSIERIIAACGRFDVCEEVIKAYENSNNIAHKLYWSLKNKVLLADNTIRIPTQAQQFVHFPETEIVTFTNLRLDDSWNILMNMNLK